MLVLAIISLRALKVNYILVSPMSFKKTYEKCVALKVDHPEHYNMHQKECINEMEILFGAQAVYYFCCLNAWKYRYRAGQKGDYEEDMRKADWYVQKAGELKNGVLI